MFSRDRRAGDGVSLFAEFIRLSHTVEQIQFFTRLLLLSSNMPSVLLPRKMVVLNIFAFVSGSINENSISQYVG